ncbi:ATP-dependent RNA helicase [Limosilactobacillus equigenerosi DSM 18793 = JCM 14505]|uniref:DEAD-box ATP-dependent RNA helicase CshB n=3 Tax=Limosilactobacillus TaxID=2742598 RepID=A0A0R1UT89_9LACO|nr:DEAD/DEAH box helicase [Limosilactobacillus equigenerosi]KRL96409.1 ATP-dependent RNA helicase [Limosilactobacillus equigenerosi DSM 18793 = JCM 14505]
MAGQFSQFKFQPFVMQALADLKFTQPTPVQQKVIPLIMKGKSVVGQSQTGSGKTHAFLLPLFSQLDVNNPNVQVVITTPSRELAYQIYNAAKQINQFAKPQWTIHNYVGGTDKQQQIDQLQRRSPQVVIGTPGRILDLVKSNALDIHEATRFVIDEADMTLDMGFLNQVDQIAAYFPENLQMLVFSATIPQGLRPFLKKYMGNPEIEEIPTETVINPNVENWLMSTKGRDKNDLVYRLLTMGDPYLALVFANTRDRAEELYNFLLGQGLKVALIHGGLEPRARKRVMRQIHNLDLQYIVATDLAARGIDIEGVSLVINDDIPTDLEYFVHRVGRTGRAKMHGTAITLYVPAEEELVEKLEQRGIKFVPKAIKDGRVVTTHDRNRRKGFKYRQAELDTTLKGYVKKQKRKVKPGYKKKIKRRIKQDEIQKRRQEQRHEFLKGKRQRQRQHRIERQKQRQGN